MAMYNIPQSGAVSQEVDDLRTARTEFAHKRSQLRYVLQDQIVLAQATSELLGVIEKMIEADYTVPTYINTAGWGATPTEQRPEDLLGTLSPLLMCHADKLQALANSYGYQISMHPRLTEHGRLYGHWGTPEQACEGQ